MRSGVNRLISLLPSMTLIHVLSFLPSRRISIFAKFKECFLEGTVFKKLERANTNIDAVTLRVGIFQQPWRLKTR